VANMRVRRSGSSRQNPLQLLRLLRLKEDGRLPIGIRRRNGMVGARPEAE
jgi:hypothetical protein